VGHQRLFEEREFKFLTRQHPVVPKKKKPGRRAGDAERRSLLVFLKEKLATCEWIASAKPIGCGGSPGPRRCCERVLALEDPGCSVTLR